MGLQNILLLLQVCLYLEYTLGGGQYISKKSAVAICHNSYVKRVVLSPFTIKGEDIKEIPPLKYLGHFICNDTIQ